MGELEKEKEKKPKMKRNRCGTCTGCKMTDGCGKCSTCLKDYPHLCAARRCSEPIFTEVVERPRGESQSSASKGRRCQECDGCKADLAVSATRARRRQTCARSGSPLIFSPPPPKVKAPKTK